MNDIRSIRFPEPGESSTARQSEAKIRIPRDRATGNFDKSEVLGLSATTVFALRSNDGDGHSAFGPFLDQASKGHGDAIEITISGALVEKETMVSPITNFDRPTRRSMLWAGNAPDRKPIRAKSGGS